MEIKTNEYVIYEDEYECRSHDACHIIVVYLARSVTPTITEIIRTLHILDGSA